MVSEEPVGRMEDLVAGTLAPVLNLGHGERRFIGLRSCPRIGWRVRLQFRKSESTHEQNVDIDGA